MSLFARGRLLWLSAFLALSAALVPMLVQAADPRAGTPSKRASPAVQADALSDDRSRFSYMIGVDVGRDIAKAGPDIDFASFRKAVENAFKGGDPLLDESASRDVSIALMQRTAVRGGRPAPGLPPGAKPPPVAKDKVGLLIGADVGRSLAPVAAEIDLDVFMRAVRSAAAGETLLLDDARIEALRQEFAVRMQAKAEAAAAETAAEGERFLARNRTRPGVIVTGSGLQYQVLRQGKGARPRATDRVRVNYRGTLLDGTEFDSSYARGVPSEFALNRVIAGWTEGVGLMPVGAKYKLWIPAAIAYGARGSGNVPPNATLVFEVELLDIL